MVYFFHGAFYLVCVAKHNVRSRRVNIGLYSQRRCGPERRSPWEANRIAWWGLKNHTDSHFTHPVLPPSHHADPYVTLFDQVQPWSHVSYCSVAKGTCWILINEDYVTAMINHAGPLSNSGQLIIRKRILVFDQIMYWSIVVRSVITSVMHFR